MRFSARTKAFTTMHEIACPWCFALLISQPRSIPPADAAECFEAHRPYCEARGAVPGEIRRLGVSWTQGSMFPAAA